MVATEKNNLLLIVLVVVLAALMAAGSTVFYEDPEDDEVEGPDTELAKFSETRDLMDTIVTITVYDDEETHQETLDAAFQRMEEIEEIASSWNESAEAYTLNLDGELDGPSDELLDIIELSIDYYEMTDGAFDITVQPLLDLWSFNPGAEKQMWERNHTDQLELINDTMPLIGCDKIAVSSDSIALEKEGMAITLGGIAKGYAVDRAMDVLEERGVKNALINAGGDIMAMGAKSDKPWNIALENPEDKGDYITRFQVEDMAVATSGNYERYFNESAKVGHILDPHSGFSVSHCWSTTIIADDCTTADTLATAVFVLGPVAGMELVEGLDGVESLIIDCQGEIYRSSGLEKYEY